MLELNLLQHGKATQQNYYFQNINSAPYYSRVCNKENKIIYIQGVDNRTLTCKINIPALLMILHKKASNKVLVKTIVLPSLVFGYKIMHWNE